jgi:peptidoglycan/xylan/chitin deacetylase (PgdA/CDA1 family)
VIKPQTILVAVLVLLVIQWGSHLATPDEIAADEATAIAAHPEPTITPVVQALPPTVTPTPEPTATPDPTPTMEPTVAPTEAPVVTERPAPPNTGEERSVIVERGTSGRTEVAFTFDAGEGAGHTAEILDLLAEYGVVATFGVTGEWAEQNSELMRRIVDEGHMLINHTYDHQSYTGVSTGTGPMNPAAFREQVERTEAIIAETTDGYQSLPYFRFPYGDYDAEALDVLGELGYAYTMWWSCDSLGWLDYSPAEIIERCGTGSEFGGPGAIILMHVANDNDWEALEPLLIHYLDAGYDLVTLEQLIQP